MNLLSRSAGPECPDCGLSAGPPQVHQVRDATRVNGARVPVRSHADRYGCDHCGRVWWVTSPYEEVAEEERGRGGEGARGRGGEAEPASDGVVFHLVRCPACSSTNTVITQTNRPIRRHKCRDCGGTFKSYEE